MIQENPFALALASNYTDEQINSLWVDIGETVIDAVIEPRSRVSKYILGGKGTGKTHLLRYYSYPIARLRSPNVSGTSILKNLKFLAVYIRATGVEAARFEITSKVSVKWQHLFGIYFELMLLEGVLDALCDIKSTTINESFDDGLFIKTISKSITDPSVCDYKTIYDFREWVISERRSIDKAVNNAAYIGALDVHVSFSIGSLCLQIAHAISAWNRSLEGTPLIYLIDEIENFSASQQQVVNTLIRYGEGLATFRVTGRLYSRKTFKTLASGEENREGSEFTTTVLDDIQRAYAKFPQFAKKFVVKRLKSSSLIRSDSFNPNSIFDELDSNNYYGDIFSGLYPEDYKLSFIDQFVSLLALAYPASNEAIDKAKEVTHILTHEMPVLLKKLNLLLFCKKYNKSLSDISLAKKIRFDSLEFIKRNTSKDNYYASAYGHWASDLFAQLWRGSKKTSRNIPYAGFKTLVKMSSGNPRNLLVILGRIYEITAFHDVEFIGKNKITVDLQTAAVNEAARFMFERDTNYGGRSGLARDSIERLASLLRTARYSLNIPEVSPLTVSFSNCDLTPKARETLDSALNYSFVFEISSGRPDRNKQRINRKIQLNPILSPKWGLPIGRRGDISLSSEIINAIFDPSQQSEFDSQLKKMDEKWSNPFKNKSTDNQQEKLF